MACHTCPTPQPRENHWCSVRTVASHAAQPLNQSVDSGDPCVRPWRDAAVHTWRWDFMIICMIEIISILIKSYNVGIMWLMNIHDSWYEMMQLLRMFNIFCGCFVAMYIMPPRDFGLGVRIDVHKCLSPNRRPKENCGFGLSTIHWTLASASALSPPSLNCEAEGALSFSYVLPPPWGRS